MIYIDTGALIARYSARDQYHQVALSAWQRLASLPWQCYTSNFVLNESFSLLARRTSYAFTAKRARWLMVSGELTILRPAQEDELKALDLFSKFADQRVSYTDCISFALMRRHRLSRAFTFDRHFSDAGFETWPLGLRPS